MANCKLLTKKWLGRIFWNITLIPLSDEEVKEVQELLNEK